MAGEWLRDQRLQDTVGQPLMEPMGPVCVCVHIPVTCQRDGNCQVLMTQCPMIDSGIVMLMRCGSITFQNI